MKSLKCVIYDVYNTMCNLAIDEVKRTGIENLNTVIPEEMSIQAEFRDRK